MAIPVRLKHDVPDTAASIQIQGRSQSIQVRRVLELQYVLAEEGGDAGEVETAAYEEDVQEIALGDFVQNVVAVLL
jgi:hypothetical protein